MSAIEEDIEDISLDVAAKKGIPFDKQVFIVGSRRSGTTWTLWLLSNHPEMVGVQHSNLIDAFKRIDKWWQDKDPYHNSIVSGNDNKNKTGLKDYLTSKDVFSQCSQLVKMVFSQAFKEKPLANVLVESQPENIDNIKLLMNLFPDAYYLNVIRDPRSVFSSWKSVATTWSSSDSFNTHLADFCIRWRREIDLSVNLSITAKNYREIRYEELQNDGVSVLQGVYDWINIESSSDLANVAIDACQLKKLRKKANMPKGFFRNGKTEGWKNELSSYEVKCIEYLLADIMDSLGYKRVNQGNITKPYRLRIYCMKKNVLQWTRKTPLFGLLRTVSHRILG